MPGTLFIQKIKISNIDGVFYGLGGLGIGRLRSYIRLLIPRLGIFHEQPFFRLHRGYYGRMLSWDERSLTLDEMRRLALMLIFMHPKKTPYTARNGKRPTLSRGGLI